MFNFLSGHRPDVTPAQVAGLLIGGIPVIASIGHAFGIFEISKEEQDALKQAVEWGVIGGIGLFAADAHVRGKRNDHDATIKAAALNASGDPPDPAVAAQAAEAMGVTTEPGGGEEKVDGVESPDEDLPSDDEEFAAPPAEGNESTVKPDAVA